MTTDLDSQFFESGALLKESISIKSPFCPGRIDSCQQLTRFSSPQLHLDGVGSEELNQKGQYLDPKPDPKNAVAFAEKTGGSIWESEGP